MLEPMTTVTDFILAAWSLYLGRQLIRRSGSQNRSELRNAAMAIWGLAFYVLAYGAAAGAIMHGFVTPHEPQTKFALWQVVMLMVGQTNFFFLSALILATCNKKGWPICINLLAFGGYATWITIAYNFNVVVFYFLLMFGAICLSCIRLPAGEKGSDPAYYFAIGFFMTLAGVLIQVFGFSPAPWFNNNDLCHVIQIIAMYPLYKGGLLLRVS